MRNFTGFSLLFIASSSAFAASSVPIIDDAYGLFGMSHVGFDVAGDKNDQLQASVVLSDGSMIVGGLADVSAGNPNQTQIVLAKLTPQGGADINFGSGGKVTLNIIPPGGTGVLEDIEITASGEIALVARYANNAFFVAPWYFTFGLLKSDGSPDTNFNLSGFRTIAGTAFIANADFGDAARVVPLAGGKLLGMAGVGSGSVKDCGAVIRLNSDGTTDSTFNGGAGFGCYSSDASPPVFQPQAMRVLTGGKILVAGIANHGSDANNGDIAVLRLLADGSVDPDFGTAGWAYVAFDQGQGLLDVGDAIAVDSQGRIVVAGYFQSAQSFDWAIARLTSSGAVDGNFGSAGRVAVAFDLGGSNDDRANSVLILPGDRILVGGSVDLGQYDGASHNLPNYPAKFAAAVELNADGTMYSAFGTGGTFMQATLSTTNYGVIDQPTPFTLLGDYLYIPGTSFKPDGFGTDEDFGVTRMIVPLFASGFEP